jgi:formylglycine-generating enzyme required for sulfatase activity
MTEKPRPDPALPPQDAPGLPDTVIPSHHMPAPGGPPGRFHLVAGAEPVPGYVLLEQLGKGGFGEVWQAAGPGGIEVALKFVRLDEIAGAVEQRSLDLIKNVRHAHLLSCFSVWQRAGYLILALELADGSLLDRLREAQRSGLNGLPREELLEQMREAAKGLDHLHTQHIQHRDIKPQNLLLVGGSVKVADFGLAKLLQHTRTKHTGAMTLAYAAPEFFREETSAHSDQYSLAVSYCELRGGRLPFTGSAEAISLGHVLHPPDLIMLPEAERPAVARALSKKPEERWPSCKALVEALTAAGRAAPLSAAPLISMACPPRTPVDAPRLACPSCGAELKLPADSRGERVYCSACRQDFAVPGDLTTRMSPLPGDLAVADQKQLMNSLGMRLVLIPKGEFWMGSPSNEPNRFDDEQQHEVEITQPFYMAAYEVTQEEYERVMGTNPSHFRQVPGQNTRRYPVENVSWEEAVAFCRKLSELPAERYAGRAYRLPTEAEWEYACRGGTTDPGPFFFRGPSRTLSSGQANFDGNHFYGDAPKGRYLKRPVPVDDQEFEPNGFGLYHIHGNVWEWCQDWYGPYDLNNGQDPRGPQDGDRRVLRGGSWLGIAKLCRAAHRYREQPGVRFFSYGFRVVLPTRTR